MKTKTTLDRVVVKNQVTTVQGEWNMSKGSFFKTRISRLLSQLVILALGSSAVAHAQNLLKNGHFTKRAAVQTIQDSSCAGPSSATNWGTWINATFPCVTNSGIELETDLLLSQSPIPSIPGAHLIHVRSTVVDPSVASPIQASGAGDGLVQVFGAYGTGPTHVLESVWVYVVHGQVGIGVGNGGDTSISATSSTHGQWEHLVGTNSVSPANEFTLYSTDPNGAEFYADDAIVCTADSFLEFERCRMLIAQ